MTTLTQGTRHSPNTLEKFITAELPPTHLWTNSWQPFLKNHLVDGQDKTLDLLGSIHLAFFELQEAGGEKKKSLFAIEQSNLVSKRS